MANNSTSESWERVPVQEMKNFMQKCMEAVGTNSSHAETLAELLVVADHRGHYSHGLNRLDMYVNDIKSGTTLHDLEPAILKQNLATAWVDGNNILGPVVGKFCIDLAIEKAEKAGIGMVVAKGSNHYGIAGWYALRAMKRGFIGMSSTNTSPLVVPTRSKKATLGTNPLSFSAPGKENDSFDLDMATSSAALGKVELKDRHGLPIPKSWGCDVDGKETTDPKSVLKDGGLLPLGGTEESSGYKGYGLATMVEVLCGILGDSNYGPHVRGWKSTGGVANLGQCFIAIDPNAFAPNFPDRMSGLMEDLRNLPTVEESKPVLVAGDPERMHMEECDKSGGIPYHPNQIKYAKNLALELGIEPPTTISQDNS